jgi:hypothetical protein
MMREANEPLTALAPLALLTKMPTCRVMGTSLAAVVVKTEGVAPGAATLAAALPSRAAARPAAVPAVVSSITETLAAFVLWPENIGVIVTGVV